MNAIKTTLRPGGILAVSICALVLAVTAGSQTESPRKLQVGDPILNGSFIRPYKNAWRLTYSKPGGESIDAAVWNDEVETIKVGDRTLLKRTQFVTYNLRKRTTTTINVFDPLTMAPISRDFKGSGGAFNHVDFTGSDIKFERLATPGGAPRQGVMHLEAPVFDFSGGLYGLILVTAPLKTGFVASLPSLDENTEAVHWITFRVTGEEMVEAGPGRKIKAWVVETDDQGPMTFWLTKEAPYIIKLVYSGPGGVTSTYTMI